MTSERITPYILLVDLTDKPEYWKNATLKNMDWHLKNSLLRCAKYAIKNGIRWCWVAHKPVENCSGTFLLNGKIDWREVLQNIKDVGLTHVRSVFVISDDLEREAKTLGIMVDVLG